MEARSSLFGSSLLPARIITPTDYVNLSDTQALSAGGTTDSGTSTV